MRVAALEYTGAELRPREYLCLSRERTRREISPSHFFAHSYRTQKRVLQIINHARKSARGRSHFAFVRDTGQRARETERERGDLKESKGFKAPASLSERTTRRIVSGSALYFPAICLRRRVSRPVPVPLFKRDAKSRCSEIQARPESLPR